MTNEIDSILKRNKITRQVYRGCYAADMIPKLHRFPSAMVVNMDESDLPGSHWVALFTPNRHHVYYFDSLGGEAPVKVQEYMRKNFNMITQQNVQIQHPQTKVCGHYAIYFVYMSANKQPFERVLRYLRKLRRPDIYVFDFVNHFLKR